MNLGEMLVAQGRFDEAESVLLAAERMMQQLERPNVHLVYEYLSRLYDGRGETDLADSNLQRAIQAAGEIGDTETQERLRTIGNGAPRTRTIRNSGAPA
jgi:predicted Zn-dependent protease